MNKSINRVNQALALKWEAINPDRPQDLGIVITARTNNRNNSGAQSVVSVKDLTAYIASQFPPATGDMLKSVYDQANIEEQLVGLTANQALSNKSVNGVTLSASGSGNDFLANDGSYKVISASQVNNDSSVSGAFVSDALNQLSSDLSGVVQSVTAGTNINLSGTATDPVVNLDSAITGVSVNGVTLTNAGAIDNFLNAQGNYISLGGGDVFKSGTPVPQQGAFWVDDETIEGKSEFTLDGSNILRFTGPTFAHTGTGVAAYVLDTSSANDYTEFSTRNDQTAIGSLRTASSGETFTVMGIATGNYTWLRSSGASSNGMMIVTDNSAPIIFGTNDTQSATILSDQSWDYGSNNISNVGALSATSFNGVALTTGGSATNFLNEQGNYVSVGGVTVTNQGNNRVITSTSTTDELNAESELTFFGGALEVSSDNGSIGVISSLTTGAPSMSVAGGSNLSLQNFGNAFGGTIAGQSRASLGVIQNNTDRLMLVTVGSDDIFFATNDTLSATIQGADQNWNFNNNDVFGINQLTSGNITLSTGTINTTSGDLTLDSLGGTIVIEKPVDLDNNDLDTTGNITGSSINGSDLNINSSGIAANILGGIEEVTTTVNSATYDMLTTDSHLLVAHTSTAPVTITLPTAQATNGRIITIKDSGNNASVNNITITTEGAETIDGNSETVLFLNGNSFSFISDGSNWFQITRAFLTREVVKSYTLSDQGTVNQSYLAGFYEESSTDSTLTIGGTVIQTFGTANNCYAAHAFCVASGPGGTDLVLTVSGTSIDDNGNRTTSDSEVLVADTDQATTDQYFETTKKWLGEVTYTLTGGAGSFTFNYGLAKYEDFQNRDFIVTGFELVGFANNNETDLDIELIYHQSTGWTYAPTGFVSGSGNIIQLSSDYSTDDQINANEYFAYKRVDLMTSINGSGLEGILVRITATTNNAIRYASAHIFVQV